MEEEDIRERLIREIRELKNEMSGLDYSMSDLSDSIDEFNDKQFYEEDGKKLLEAYKRDLERQNLWTKELDEHYDMFTKFDLPSILNAL